MRGEAGRRSPHIQLGEVRRGATGDERPSRLPVVVWHLPAPGRAPPRRLPKAMPRPSLQIRRVSNRTYEHASRAAQVAFARPCGVRGPSPNQPRLHLDQLAILSCNKGGVRATRAIFARQRRTRAGARRAFVQYCRMVLPVVEENRTARATHLQAACAGRLPVRHACNEEALSLQRDLEPAP
jgi:hypothetical protein